MPQDETEIFQHYRVLRRNDGSLWELGRGAMGVTYKAIDTNLDAPVALKVINTLYTGNDAARERFIREARAAASLRHRNVASIYHLGHDEQSFFYAMEFIDGETVEHFVQREGPQSWRLALPTVLQVTRALMAAHEKRIVHRDIKPANVMLVREAGEDDLMVKVIDFGLAKSLVEEGGSVVSVTGSGFLGTPLYASPEQCEELAPDIRSDIYSLGVTLWFLLAGRPPFEGGLGKVFSQHLHAPPPWGQLPAAVPEPVRALLTRMLAKDRAGRPQTPAELRRDLETCLRACGQSIPVVAEAQPARISLEDTLRRNDGCLSGALVADLLVPLAKIVDAAGTAPLDLTPGGVWVAPANSSGNATRRRVPYTGALLAGGKEGTLEVCLLPEAGRPPIPTGNETIPPKCARFTEPVAALAALAYELLDGAAPGFGRGYRPLPECDEESNALLRRALEDGASAFADARTFAAALAPSLRRRPAKSAVPSPAPPVAAPPTQPFPAKNIAVIALAAAALIVIFVWWAVARNPTPAQKASSTPSPRASSTPSPASVSTASPKEEYEAGINLWNGMGGTLIDQPRAVTHFQAAAARGYAPAQAFLAVVYQEGLGGVPKNAGQAEKLAAASLAAGLRDEAQQGDAEAQCRLGSLYGEGVGMAKDESKAAELFAKAADQGLAAAQNNLGNLYFYGLGVEKDLAKAVELYAKAADQGLSASQNALGFCRENGFGVEKDPAKAAALYQKAADQGNAPGQFNLGRCYFNGFGVEKDLGKATELYKKAADQGNSQAQNNLGVCFLNGFGVEKDVAKAVELYKAAADQGNADGENNLGLFYYNGTGAERDLDKALDLFKKAAAQGNADAQNSLGYCYFNGFGVERDLGKAIDLYKKGAAQGNAAAQNNLGLCCFNGVGVEKDGAAAAELFRKSADQGYAGGVNNLGVCYENGIGVEKDLPRAVDLYTKAADLGYPQASFNLGVCYENGLGVEKNFRKAVEFYRRAADQGNMNAQNRLRNLRARERGR